MKHICEKCKNQVSDNSNFCNHCGSEFLNDVDTSKFNDKQKEKFNKVMKEFKEGELTSNGKSVKNRNQALAIAISSANSIK